MAEKRTEKEMDEIVFFCKDTGRIIPRDEIERVGKKYVYKNKSTGSKNIAFGTRRSVENFYKLDDKMQKERAKLEKKSKARGAE